MSRPKVLVTRRIPQIGLDLLSKVADIAIYEGGGAIEHEMLLEKVRDVNGLLCMLDDRVDAQVIGAASELLVISSFAVGINNIDVEAATENGIAVTNTPGVLREATADLTWALLMACARRISRADEYVREGKFKLWGPELFLGNEVYGRTIGIVGMGDIGTAVARRAKGFGMTVLYHNRKKSIAADELDAELVPLDDLLARSDFISLHVPLSAETKHMIGERELHKIKCTAILINASRGELINEKALVAALKERRIAGAALDVYEHEPMLTEGLSELDNVVLTPHIGSATFEARERMSLMAVSNMINVLNGKMPENLVNPGYWAKRSVGKPR